MIYNVIGLMSGSSLDGLDIAAVRLTEIRGAWTFEIIKTECLPYEDYWFAQLPQAHTLSVPDFLHLHTAYGRYLGEAVQGFRERHNLEHGIHFVASHGHTVYHSPGANGATFQLGDGAALASGCGLPVISDLRNMDVALGGQGAPIVPLGDKLLFSGYDAWLNLGGIANITMQKDGELAAWDIAPCNQLLNKLAEAQGKSYDEGGAIAAGGTVNQALLEMLLGLPYFQKPAPKSLANTFLPEKVWPLFEATNFCIADQMATAVEMIAMLTAMALPPAEDCKLLVTGGGAHNKFLKERLQHCIARHGWAAEVPDAEVVDYKEAIVMALLGALRWREEETVLSSVTGARRSSVGGAIWLGGV